MKNLRTWTGFLLIIMGIAHSFSTNWHPLLQMIYQGWWKSADTPAERAALWFLVAGFALIIMGFLVINHYPTRIAAAVLLFILMLGTFTSTALFGAAIGMIVAILLFTSAIWEYRSKSKSRT
ncbi:DUF6463 family protein [Corynebacterium freiburgense]|uniref:DUF6463 family protein n=1 Tax=Corynebacterium freiburgense TaxID=556548 RepID=UPI00047A75DA|nr:DUF6463 family protein [Corynebacterium freiburgense]WJZ01858.1 hypothetical protein CFREI_02770 [Corynebacterium freiburgense]